MQFGRSCSFLFRIYGANFTCFAKSLAFFSGSLASDLIYFQSLCHNIYAGLDKPAAMVCGNMEVEATPETFMDDLYDNKEEKVI